MPFGGSSYQFALALLIGIVGALRGDHTTSQAAALGAKASFIVGTAFMLCSENRWWPVTLSLLALVSWVLSGGLVASFGYWLTTRLRRLSAR
jgi:hypothetical protein